MSPISKFRSRRTDLNARRSRASFDSLEARCLLYGAIAKFEFPNPFGGIGGGQQTSSSPSWNNADITVSAITRGTGFRKSIDFSGIPDTMIAAPVALSDPEVFTSYTYQEDFEDAVANGDYFKFTITPTTGKTLNLDRIDFSASTPGGNYTEFGMTHTLGSASPTNTVNFMTSFSTTVASAAIEEAEFEYHDITTSITIYFVVFGNMSGEDIVLGNITGDDIIVHGSVTNTVPNAPSNLTIKQKPSDLFPTLKWNDNSAWETGFTIYKATDSAFSDATTIPVAGINTGSTKEFVDTAAEPGKVYYYKVVATGNGSPSSASNSKGFRPFRIYEAWKNILGGTVVPEEDDRFLSDDGTSMVVGLHPTQYAINATNQNFPIFKDSSGDPVASPGVALTPSDIYTDSIEAAVDAVADGGIVWFDIEMGFNHHDLGTPLEIIQDELDAFLLMAKSARDYAAGIGAEGKDIQIVWYQFPPLWSGIDPNNSTYINEYETFSLDLFYALTDESSEDGYFDYIGPTIYTNENTGTLNWHPIGVEFTVNLLDLMSSGAGHSVAMPAFALRPLDGTPEVKTVLDPEDLQLTAELFVAYGNVGIRWDKGEIEWTEDMCEAQQTFIDLITDPTTEWTP